MDGLYASVLVEDARRRGQNATYGRVRRHAVILDPHSGGAFAGDGKRDNGEDLLRSHLQ